MNRMFITAPLALAVSAFFVGATVSPATAKEEICTVMPQNIRTIATNADANVVKKAMKYTRTGELLCEAGNAHAAKQKFELAFKALGTTSTEYASVNR